MEARLTLRALLVALLLVLGSVSAGLPASAEEGKSDESQSSSSEKDDSDDEDSDDEEEDSDDEEDSDGDKDDSDEGKDDSDDGSESDQGEDSDDAEDSDDGGDAGDGEDSVDGEDGDASKDDKSKEDKSKEDKSKEDKSKEDKSKDDKSKDEKSKDDKLKNDKLKNDKLKNDKPKKTKAPICHGTGSDKHPYVSISPSANGTANGHAGHEDDTSPLLDGGCQTASAPLEPSEISEQRLRQTLAVIAAAAPNITICHATQSSTSPYVANSPAAQGVVNGHAGHDGPVFHAGATSWGDIIPPFTNVNGISFAGQNWTAAGRAIYNNGCEPVAPATPPTPPVLTVETAPVCHAIGDDEYVRIRVRANATAGGHAAHLSDIIPPFTFGSGESFAGLNWDDEGEEIFDDGCERDDDDNDDSDDSDDSDDGDDGSEGLPDTGGLPVLALLVGGLSMGLGLLLRRVTMSPRR